MGLNDIDIRFGDVSLKKELRDQIRLIAEQIYLLSPSDSYLKFIFEKSKNQVKVKGRVASQAGLFFSEAISDCPIKASKKLKLDLCNQFNKWKKGRFAEASENHAS